MFQRRRIANMPALNRAMISKTPWTMYCQYVGTPMIDRPLLITPISMTPIKVPMMWNLPGLRDEAPMNTAANALRR